MPGVVAFLFEDIQPTVETFVQQSSAQMIGVLGPLAAALLTIYVLLWGAALASGQISEPFTDFMKRVVRMALIIALAMTAGTYQSMVAETLQKAPMQLAGEMSFQGAPPIEDANSLATVLDGFMEKGMEVAEKPWMEGVKKNSESMMGITSEGLLLQACAIVLMIIVVIVVAISAGIMFVAYMALAVLLGIGPLFILFAIFPATQRWMEAWLGQAVNYGILFVLVAVASALLFSILDAYYDSLVTGGAEAYQVLWMVLKAIALAIGCIGVLLQLNSIASGLAGGAAIHTANVAGRLAGMGMSGVRGVTTGGAMARTAAGNTRAAYRGMTGQELANRHARTSRDLAHASGTKLAMARQVFTARNTIKGT